jgi:hypothetical protein
LSTLAGYAPARSGEALSVRDVLPWWEGRAAAGSKRNSRKAGR